MFGAVFSMAVFCQGVCTVLGSRLFALLNAFLLSPQRRGASCHLAEDTPKAATKHSLAGGVQAETSGQGPDAVHISCS